MRGKASPRCVIPVDLFGLTADYDTIDKIAKENKMFIIEDAAQSFGAKYRDKMACAFRMLRVKSFFPVNPWAALRRRRNVLHR